MSSLASVSASPSFEKPALRLGPRLVVQKDHDKGRNVLIVGAGKSGRELATYIRNNPRTGIAVRGFVDERAPLGGDIRGRVSDLARVIRAHFVDEIILAPPHDREIFHRVAREARRNRIAVSVVPDLFGFAPTSVTYGTLGQLPVLKFYEERRPLAGVVCKRAMDVVFAAVALLFISPLLAVVAGLIKFDSPGPIFYPAIRVGKKGHSFVCYKFRTMIAGADCLREQLRALNEREGPLFKIRNDPRITRLGYLLRRYSLDEMPQLWNVLRGEMSLVGPRPHPLDDFERYQLEHLRRLNVVPGITGLWQITAREDPSFDRNMQLDLKYIEHWSLWLDLCILLKTIAVVFRGTGA